MARRDQGAQEQLLRALVQYVLSRGAPGQRGGCLRIARGQQAQRRLVKLLPRPGRAPAAGQHQPHTERGAVAWLHTGQQLPADVGRGQGAVLQRPDVKPQRASGQPHRITAQKLRVPAAAAQISQAPPQRPERVIRFAEQLRGKLPPGQRPLGQGHPGQQRPGLLPPRLARLPGSAFDTRMTEQPHPHAHRR